MMELTLPLTKEKAKTLKVGDIYSHWIATPAVTPRIKNRSSA